MKRYIAMLRGINLGSHNRISMPALKSAFEKKGFSDVETYVQSGNVVFGDPGADSAILAKNIHELLLKEFGLTIPVVIRTVSEMNQIASTNPFLNEPSIDTTKLHVTFLTEKPAATSIKELGPANDGRDEWKIVDRDIYLHCPIDYGHSKLTNGFFEKKLGVGATTRNWKSVLALNDLAKEEN